MQSLNCLHIMNNWHLEQDHMCLSQVQVLIWSRKWCKELLINRVSNCSNYICVKNVDHIYSEKQWKLVRNECQESHKNHSDGILRAVNLLCRANFESWIWMAVWSKNYIDHLFQGHLQNWDHTRTAEVQSRSLCIPECWKISLSLKMVNVGCLMHWFAWNSLFRKTSF